MDNSKVILDHVNSYYSKKIMTHGATPRGVDWNSQESQEERFRELCKIIDASNFTLLDYGAGYGALLSYLLKIKHDGFSYTGYDISTEMTKKSKEIHAENTSVTWLNTIANGLSFDYVIASGLFNVKMDFSETDWKEYVINTINRMNELSTKGFAFNILTSYSDEEHKKENLYYAQPEDFFSYCKKHFSKRVALIHDYQLYEFTILVRK